MRTIRRLVLAAAAVAVVVPASAATAAPAVNGVFDLPGVQTNGQLVVGPDNNVYVALEQAVGRVTADGTTTRLLTTDLNNALASPTGGMAVAGGFVWVSQSPSAGKEAIVKFAPGSPGTASGVAGTGITAGATAMTAGPDGNIWVAVAGKIVKFSPANPAGATSYTVANLAPKAMVAASDGTLWVTDTANGGRLLNVTTAGAVTPYTVGGQPQFLAPGPSAQVAFGNPNSTPQQIGRLSPGGTPLTVDRPNGSDPFGVALGADGAYWIAEFAGNRLARIAPDGQLTTLTGFPAVAGQGPRQLVAGPGNTLWVALDKPGDPANTKIARVTGVDPVPTVGGGATGPDEPPADTTRPAISAAKLARTSVRAGTRSVSLRFTLSEPASVKATVARRAPGRRRGSACVAPSRKLAKARPCARFVRVRTIPVTGRKGLNVVSVRTRALAAGRYRITVAATDAAGNRTVPITRALLITAKPRRR